MIKKRADKCTICRRKIPVGDLGLRECDNCREKAKGVYLPTQEEIHNECEKIKEFNRLNRAGMVACEVPSPASFLPKVYKINTERRGGVHSSD
jgi:hypothetical protein